MSGWSPFSLRLVGSNVNGTAAVLYSVSRSEWHSLEFEAIGSSVVPCVLRDNELYDNHSGNFYVKEKKQNKEKPQWDQFASKCGLWQRDEDFSLVFSCRIYKMPKAYSKSRVRSGSWRMVDLPRLINCLRREHHQHLSWLLSGGDVSCTDCHCGWDVFSYSFTVTQHWDSVG